MLVDRELHVHLWKIKVLCAGGWFPIFKKETQKIFCNLLMLFVLHIFLLEPKDIKNSEKLIFSAYKRVLKEVDVTT